MIESQTRADWFRAIDANLSTIVDWAELKGSHKERGQDDEVRKDNETLTASIEALIRYLAVHPAPIK